MIEPKIFYRKLDFILDRIGRGKTGKDFLFTIIKELENTFRNDLHICKGRVYEEYEDEYVLMTPEDSPDGEDYSKYLPINSPGVQAVLKYHLYIFDNPAFSIDSSINSGEEYAIPVALSLNSAEYKWILIFELMSGWQREEVELCLNAVRTLLNYRLYSESIKNEMVQAANIQQSLLPSSAPQIAGYEIAGLSKPAEIVGGDFFDYYQSGGGSNFGFSIGDASGHGMPAALLVRDVVTGLRMGIGENDEIKDRLKMIKSHRLRRLNENRTLNILKKLNRVIFKSTYSTRFVSLFVGEFDSRGNFFYVNAGHPAPILIKNKSITELDSTGPIFGALQEINLSGSNARMSPGDILVLFTDGIIERQDSLNEQYGMGRLRELVYSNRNKSAKELKDLIFDSVRAFGKSHEWEDDATILVIRKQ